MDNKGKKRSTQDEQQPGSMSSYNNRSDNRKGRIEDVKKEKVVDENYENNKANSPAASSSEGERKG